MPASWIDEKTVEKLKHIVGSRCELCREIIPLQNLVVHAVPAPSAGEAPDPRKRFLILCHDCHCHVHDLPVTPERQMEWVKRRSFPTKRMLRKILGYSPEVYLGTDITDLAALYQEMNSSGSPVMFRWAG